jgi:hypothetical protein
VSQHNVGLRGYKSFEEKLCLNVQGENEFALTLKAKTVLCAKAFIAVNMISAK